MNEKIYVKLNPKFSNYQEIINSIKDEELLQLLEKHKIDLATELGKIASPLNKDGNMFAMLSPSPLMPSDEQIEYATKKQQRQEGVLSYYPEYIFADDKGLGFLVRYRNNKNFDYYAMVVRDYNSCDYSKQFSTQHNMPKVALKEYADELDFSDLTKLSFYKKHSLLWLALCLCTDNFNHKGDIYVQEISQSTMDNDFKKQELLSKLLDNQLSHDYYITALYSNGGEILHCEDKDNNPFDAFILNIEYYDLNKHKLDEEHYVFAYGQKLITYLVNGEVLKKNGKVFYDIDHSPDGRGTSKPISKEEAEAIFYKELAPMYSLKYPILESNPMSVKM